MHFSPLCGHSESLLQAGLLPLGAMVKLMLFEMPVVSVHEPISASDQDPDTLQFPDASVVSGEQLWPWSWPFGKT
jgi:hypothetical protein